MPEPPHSVVSCECLLGEGPVWYDSQLWWVDIHGKSVHSWREGQKFTRKYLLPERVGFAVPVDQVCWVVGLQSGIYLWHPEKNKLELLHEPEADMPQNRFNDGKCDPQGRLWAGTMDLKAKPGKAALYRMSGRDHCQTMRSKVTISNGLAWSLDSRKMYYIDTPTRAVTAYDFNSQSGDISNPATVIEIPEDFGAPDGMTIDCEGMLWVALWGGFGVVRIDPECGKILERIKVPAPQTTSCTFGGENLDTLFLTTARIGMSEDQLQSYPQAGDVFAVKPGTQGLPATSFKL